MKSKKIVKIISGALTIASMIAINPIRANADVVLTSNNQKITLSKSTQNNNIKPTQNALKRAEKNYWFKENGNTYFKLDDNNYAKGWLVIDLGVYYFNENGVSQTNPFTINGVTYSPRTIGYTDSFQVIDNAPYIDTSIATGKFKNGWNDAKYKAPEDPTMDLYDTNSVKSTLKEIVSSCVNNFVLNKNKTTKYDKNTNTITMKKGTELSLGCLEFRSPTQKYQAPAFTVYFKSENYDIVETDTNLGFLDGYVNAVGAKINAKKVGTTKVTFTANNIKETFNVVVTD